MDGRAIVRQSYYDSGLDDKSVVMARARKRWQRAFAVIYCARTFLSLCERSKKTSKKPHTVIEIQPDYSPPITPSQLAKIMREKSLEALRLIGGVDGIAKSLKTNVASGIFSSDHDIGWRKEKFGSNTYNRPSPKNLVHFVWDALQDLTVIIFLICATVSLGLGIKLHGLKEGWYEGGSIFITVFLLVIVTAISNFKQDRQFNKLSKISDNIMISVVRDSRPQQISIFDIVVGDVVILKIGDQIPADGLFIDGQSLLIDESSMTGESDHIEVNSTTNPFLLLGSKVGDGYGRMMVTSVGMNTSWGEMMSSINRDVTEQTPLQVRLNKLTLAMAMAGVSAALLFLIVLLAQYFTGIKYKSSSSILGIFSAAVTIVVAALPKALPSALTRMLAHTMKKMMADLAMVRKLSACETMGSVTVICTDKTGTLTLNQMRVTKAWIGEEECSRVTAPSVLELLQQGVALNTTGIVYMPYQGGVPKISGSQTEKAILSWAIKELGMDMETIKESCTILQVESFNSTKKRSGVMMKNNSDGSIHVHWKGAAENILAMCSNYYTADGTKKGMDEEGRKRIGQVIQGMAASGLRCIAFAHRKAADEELEYQVENAEPRFRLKEEALSLLGIVGLKDPCRPDARNGVEVCKQAGLGIKMITGDNIFTAKAIAEESGILGFQQQEGEVVEGEQFRNYTHAERMEKVNKIRVMARSSPFDKLLMVQCLKKKGEVVAVIGDGTNDAPALKEADIGLSMGIQGSEVAKESSDIIILDDNFSTVVNVVRWGRCIYNNLQKFNQFQLTVNVAALVIYFIAAISGREVPLTTLQLGWVNIIIYAVGAVALTTESPTVELLKKKPPVGRTTPLVTNTIFRDLMFHALYQIAVLLTLHFKGESIFSVTTKANNTIMFNTFVLCLVFNAFNARRLERKNIFQGILKAPLFIGIIAITIIIQVLMVEILGKYVYRVRLNGQQWSACIVIAFISWPIGFLVKFIPVPAESIFISLARSIAKAKKFIHRFSGLETRPSSHIHDTP